jgi:hypothetical protein
MTDWAPLPRPPSGAAVARAPAGVATSGPRRYDGVARPPGWSPPNPDWSKIVLTQNFKGTGSIRADAA